MKPYLLVDIDGVLNPFAAKPTQRPDGYDTHRLTPAGWREPLRVWLNPKHGPMLLALTDLVELAWATTWIEQANELIGPRIGLPELPVVPVMQPSWSDRGPHIWKLPAVKAYVGDRPFAWFDDDFTKADLAWAEERTAAGFPTLLLPISPRIGIVQGDVDRVAAWAPGAARDAKQRCEQCGRVGTRGFIAWPEETLTLMSGVVETIPAITLCASKTACRKRWPKTPRN